MNQANRHVDEVLTAEVPALAHDEATQLLRDHYGIAGALTPLSGERDQNFRVDSADGKSFVLKIANVAEADLRLDFQLKALDHIAATDPELPVPRTIAAVDGRKMISLQLRGHLIRARLVSHLPGKPALLTQTTPLFRRRLGLLTAKLDRALADFDHPGADDRLIWDLQHAGALASKVALIADIDRRALAERATQRFITKVEPEIGKLRQQVIHNDFNQNNVLRDETTAAISGIIDFGDMVRSPLVNEVAIAIAHQLYRQNDPLAVACEFLEGYSAVLPLEEAEIGLLPDIIAMRLAAREIIAAWRQGAKSGPSTYSGVISAMGWEALARWTALDQRQMVARLVAAGRAPPKAAKATGDAEFDQLLGRRQAYLGPLYKEFYRQPFFPVKGEGVWVTDHRGRRYLDAYNNVPHVGHCHPHVVEAVARQAATFNSNTRYPSDVIVQYAERIAATMPEPLKVCIFVCSGTEANELAWRIACANSGGNGAIVTRAAFHGNSTVIGALDTSTIPADRLEPWVATVPAPEFAGHRADRPLPQAQDYAQSYRDAAEQLTHRGFQPAAFFVCPAFASDGLHMPPKGFIEPAVAELRNAGALIVADEVQTALGRTGDHFWGFQHAGFTPDIVTMGKPMGNGLPLAVVVTSRELVEGFLKRGRYFNTFGGNQVAAAAGMAVLDVVEKENLQENALKVGASLRQRLAALMPRHGMIGDVRGSGFFAGVEIVRDRESDAPDPDKARTVIEALLRRGVLVGITGAERNLLKIRPPMVFTREHADLLVTALDEALAEVG